MTFLRNHWYDIGGVVGVCMALIIWHNWGSMSTLLKIAVLNFFVILWHEFEEFRFPGGEPAITNLAMQPSTDGPADRYPLNQNNAMVINVVAAYVCYLLPVFFPEIIWLSFMPIVFGLTQLVMHVILTPIKIHALYSPGELAVVFGHLPLGIWWFVYTISNGLLGWLDVLFGLLYIVAFIGIFMLKIGYGILQSTSSPYVFPKAEFERAGYAKRIRNQKK
ncbi:HXXEE domain-containing protein [Levilactobacillus sp. N40-8-2]|uniref:HXXEE domain-containing protein n=1 Tax=Levilactobacillus muriae TaxID=3238987 RepID=UPI0038B41081